MSDLVLLRDGSRPIGRPDAARALRMMGGNLLVAGLLLTTQAYAQFAFSDSLEHLVVYPQSRGTLWANTTANGNAISILYRSSDQGKTWQGIRYQTDPAKSPRIHDIQVHPTLGDKVFVLTTGEGGYL